MIRLVYIGRQDLDGMADEDGQLVDGSMLNILAGGRGGHPNGSTVTTESLKEMGVL